MKPYAIRRGAVHLSAHSWDLIRCAYLDGASAKALSDHYGISRSALYKRAALEGWRRCDLAARDAPAPQPAPLAMPLVSEAAPLPDTPGELVPLCLRAMAGAVQAGRIRDALDLARLIEILRRMPTPPSAEELQARTARSAALIAELFGDDADEAGDEDAVTPMDDPGAGPEAWGAR